MKAQREERSERGDWVTDDNTKPSYLARQVRMSPNPRLLLVGDDVIFLRVRKMILDIQFSVSISDRLAEAARQIEFQPFDLVVICGDPENWKQIAELASLKNAQARIVVITSTEYEHATWVHAAIGPTRGPYELLKLCAGLFGLGSTMRAHGFSLGGATRSRQQTKAQTREINLN
jgi:hypothetical protein